MEDLADLAGVFGVDGAVDGAIGASLFAGKVCKRVAVVANLLVVRWTKSPGIAGGAVVAVGGVVGVAELASVAVPAHDIVVTG